MILSNRDKVIVLFQVLTITAVVVGGFAAFLAAHGLPPEYTILGRL